MVCPVRKHGLSYAKPPHGLGLVQLLLKRGQVVKKFPEVLGVMPGSCRFADITSPFASIVPDVVVFLLPINLDLKPATWITFLRTMPPTRTACHSETYRR